MRAIKKIVALATGATMVGATIMGAMAADLANYPAPFVEGCGFSGAIVVGEAAAAEDVVGAVDIASALAVSGTTTGGGTGTTVSATGESVKIETSTNNLAVGETLTSVQTVPLDDGDLPNVLADGTYKNGESNEYDYEQEIRINPATTFTHFADTDYEDKEPTLGIQVARAQELANYTLDFVKSAKSDAVTTAGVAGGDILEDFEDTQIEIMGKIYDITKARNTSGTVELTLMGGATRDILEQGQSKTYTLNDKEYEVEVTYINGDDVKLKINGEVTDLMVKSDTYKTTDGTTIGIREVMEEEAGEVDADKVEFYLGAEKLTLKDGDNLELSDDDVDDIMVYIDETNGAELELNAITLTWAPDDELFITEAQEAIFPGLESFKISYEGLTTVAEEVIEIENNGDDMIQLKVPIEGGVVTFDLLTSNGSWWENVGGEDADEYLITDITAVVEFNRSKNNYFIVSDSTARESHLVEVTKIDDTDGVTFKDVATGTKYEDRKAGTFRIGDNTINVIAYNEAFDNVTIQATGANAVANKLYTEKGLTIVLPDEVDDILPATNSSDYTLVFIEEDKNEGLDRSEERRVGKECRSRWSPYH